MTQCAAVQSITYSDGAGLVTLDVLVPVVETTCTTLSVLTPSELALLNANPFVLSVEDAGQIALAIAALWAGAYAFRMLKKAMAIDEKETQS